MIFIYYPTSNFDLSITIVKSDAVTPVMICDKTCCSKYNNGVTSCRCFETNGIGYLKIDNKHGSIDIPVYITKYTNNFKIHYLYPQFGYLRDLFYNITVSNSLVPPSKLLETKASNDSIKIDYGITPGSGWAYYYEQTVPQNDILRVFETHVGVFDYIDQQRPSGSVTYRYSWNDTANIIATLGINNTSASFRGILYADGSYSKEFGNINLTPTSTDEQNNLTIFSLPAGHFDNNTPYTWLSFRVLSQTQIVLAPSSVPRFSMTVTVL